MFKWIITYIFTNVLVTIYAPPQPEPDPPGLTTLRNRDFPFINMEIIDYYIAEINPEEVLPIVLFQIRQRLYTLELPDEIFSVGIWERKIVLQGTKFTRNGLQGQIFFCPKLIQNKVTQEQELCLAPQDFENLQQLRCAEQPVPSVIPNARCGFQDEALFYTLAYKFCDSKGKYKYKSNTVLSVYDICYDTENRKTLYTVHLIRSGKILQSSLLYRERTVGYDYLPINGLPTANQGMIQSLLQVDQQSAWDPPMYRVQQLVPEEDMALATWRKPTFRFPNTELQLSVLFEIWNDINSIVREKAIQNSYWNDTFCISTGVFDNDSDLPESTDGQMYNKWVKVITVKNLSLNTVESAGVAILMNNFLNFYTNDPALQRVQNELEGLCPDDVCANSEFKIRVENVGGQLRCCRINPLIAQLFNLRINPNLPLLGISGLTIPPI